jgi:hypothetical protein
VEARDRGHVPNFATVPFATNPPKWTVDKSLTYDMKVGTQFLMDAPNRSGRYFGMSVHLGICVLSYPADRNCGPHFY